jgi:hypothetical protein
MGFDPCNRTMRIWELTMTPIPKVGIPLGVWGSIPSHSLALPPSLLARRLRLWHMLCCSLFWCHLYYKLVWNLGFKFRFQRCSRKGGHENGSEYGIITPNINTQHFVSNMWNIFLNTFCCLHVYVIYFYWFACFISRSMVFKNQILIVLFWFSILMHMN